MKKFLALFLALLMVLSLVACGDNGDSSVEGSNSSADASTGDNSTGDTSNVEDEKPPVEAEDIGYTPLLYFSFDDAAGLTSVIQGDLANNPALDGATYAIIPSNHPILIAEGQGAVGNALYLDGKYGVTFDMVEIADDSYTISFWYNADRVATYGPVVQMGRNIGMSDATSTVTWINVTKTTWGTNDADIFPVVWNRNSEYDVWPWTYSMDDLEHGKREWAMLTIVADGTRYTADDGLERVATQIYLNGELMWDANAENMYYQGLSPEIFAGDGLEGLIGINYWDTTYKGFIDELYVYDEALTAGQVKTLFEQGNPPASPVAPETPEYTEDTEVPDTAEPIDPDSLEAAPVDASAIDVLGTPERVLGWWSDNTDGYELADGATLTLKLNNYSDGKNNWDNFVIGLTNTAVTTDLLASADNYAGYAEYAVIRADAYGWGDDAYAGNFETSWTDWASWLNLMTDAEVEIVLTREGGVVTINYTFTGADGTVMTETAEITSTMTAESPVYVFLGGEGAYIELLSAE